MSNVNAVRKTSFLIDFRASVCRSLSLTRSLVHQQRQTSRNFHDLLSENQTRKEMSSKNFPLFFIFMIFKWLVLSCRVVSPTFAYELFSNESDNKNHVTKWDLIFFFFFFDETLLSNKFQNVILIHRSFSPHSVLVCIYSLVLPVGHFKFHHISSWLKWKQTCEN